MWLAGDSEAEDGEESEEYDIPVQKDAGVVDANVSDMDYLRSRVTQKFDEPASDDDEEVGNEDDDEEADEEQQAVTVTPTGESHYMHTACKYTSLYLFVF